MPSPTADTSPTTIYRARTIRTMTPSQPTVEAVAVREGRVLAIGTVEECRAWGPATIDDTFADQVLVPGFVEAHSHVMAGMWAVLPYLGWFERRLPDGIAPAIRSYTDLVARLRAVDAAMTEDEAARGAPPAPLVAGGFDPIYFRDEARLDRHHLDLVSTTRPIFVLHASGHLATVNTALLERYDIGADHPAPGVGRDGDGLPNGELREPAAMGLARDEYRSLGDAIADPRTVAAFGAMARDSGVTTAAELGGMFFGRPDAAQRLRDLTAAEEFPLRVAVYPLPQNAGRTPDELVEEFRSLRALSHDKFRFPGIKILLDGSIQGWTAMISWPGYHTGSDHGQFLLPPERLVDLLRPFHRAGVNIHCHCNGDLTAEVFIDAVDQLLREHAWLDHRHTVQHAQLLRPAQIRRMRNLQMCANFFANHLWFWGDQHHDLTVGPERAHRIDPCGTALRFGVPFSIHSDAGVTPLGQLHTMWCAVNRVTPSGRVLGPEERIPAAAALEAVTLGAAYQLHLDDELGSIEVGKRADFAVLDADPLAVDPMAIRDIGVWGTVLGGVVQPAGTGAS